MLLIEKDRHGASSKAVFDAQPRGHRRPEAKRLRRAQTRPAADEDRIRERHLQVERRHYQEHSLPDEQHKVHSRGHSPPQHHESELAQREPREVPKSDELQ